MRVLMFGWEFPPYQAGGLATATVGLVTGLVRQGVEVTLVVPFPVDQSGGEGVRLIGAPEPGSVRRVLVPSPLQPYGDGLGYTEVFARERGQARRTAVYGADLVQAVERFAAFAAGIAARVPHDVIDAHDWITFAAARAAQAVSRRPYVAHIHATEYDRAGESGNPAILAREGDGMRRATRVISNSETLKRQVVARFGVSAARVDVVHWGIADAAVQAEPLAPFPAGTPVVLFLGRMTWQKGPDWFLEMAGQVAGIVPEARFIMAGSGDMLPGLIRRAAELGIAHRVHFTGGLGPEAVERVLRTASVCVMPSVNEPFGLVALESLRAGTPCLVPRASGAAEVLRHALKVDFWDLRDMTTKVVAVLRHAALRGELSRRGSEELRLPRFGLDEPARRTREVYARALRQSQGVAP